MQWEYKTVRVQPMGFWPRQFEEAEIEITHSLIFCYTRFKTSKAKKQ